MCLFSLQTYVFFLTLCSTRFADVIRSLHGFVDGACCSTQNLSSATWVIYDPNGELIKLQGIYVGRTTNNIVEYSVVIELLLEVVALGIRDLVVKLDSQLVVLHLTIITQ